MENGMHMHYFFIKSKFIPRHSFCLFPRDIQKDCEIEKKTFLGLYFYQRRDYDIFFTYD